MCNALLEMKTGSCTGHVYLARCLTYHLKILPRSVSLHFQFLFTQKIVELIHWLLKIPDLYKHRIDTFLKTHRSDDLNKIHVLNNTEIVSFSI